MLITGDDRSSRIVTCLAAAPQFLLSVEEAGDIIIKKVECIVQNWSAVCDQASLSEVDRNLLWGNQIFNPYMFESLQSGTLVDLASRRHSVALP
jgi:serine/threonine-protein kinase HipA